MKKSIYSLCRHFVFIAAILPVFAVTEALGASIEWQPMQGRERIVISKSMSDGMAGNISRIDPKGIAVPFAAMPGGLILAEQPKGASIIQGTAQFGQTLAILTQTPKFGFVVSRQTPTQIVIDFFPDELGARWKPEEATAAQPGNPARNEGVSTTVASEGQQVAPRLSPPSAASSDRGGATAPEPSPAQFTPEAVPSTVGGKDSAVSLIGQDKEGAASKPATPIGWKEQPVPTNAPVLTADGRKPVTADVPASPLPVVSLPAGTPQTSSLPENILLDTRQDTAPRNASLPTPGLDGSQPAPSVLTLPPRAEQQEAGTSAPAPQVTSPVAMDEPAPVVHIPDVVQLPAAPLQGERKGSGTDDRSDGVSLLRGVGTRVGPGSYRGIYNPHGVEGLASSVSPREQESVISPTHTESSGASSVTETLPPPVEETSGGQPPSVGEPAGQGVLRQGAEPSANQENSSGAVSPEQPDAEQVTATDALETPVTLENDENVIYVNEAGEEIVPPADPVVLFEEIRALMAEKDYAAANEVVTALLDQTNLTKKQRENALHTRAEILFFLHRDNLEQHASSIIEATDLAINVNTRSPQNAVALLRLGYINLQLENIPEAEARFNMLRRMFPNDENVPLSYYYWGDYFYNHDELERAIDQFQVVTQKYPGSKYAREASLGLARSFYRLGYYEQAFNIVEYIEQRWPRFYLNYPPFLNMMGDVAFRLNNFDFATRYYWLYVNLTPEGEEVDVILTRIGDIYSLQQQSVAAREVYGEVVERFPDSDGGLIALMRLAEESINDDPTIATMFNAFDNKPVLRPVDVYKKIIAEHPESKYVSLAQLKLAMWHLWNHEYTTTLDIADAFLRSKPQDELAPKMKEVALKTFAVLSAESVANGSYSRMRSIWEEYPMLQEQEEILTPESRVALGVSYWKDGRPDDALIAVEPFFLGNKIPEYSEMALTLVLQIYLQYDQWPAIEEVARRVSLWEIDTDNQMQLDYALALAREKMGKPDEAAVLWEKLYDSKRLPDDQMAFATYFLARDAEKRQRNDEAYLLGVEALKRLRGEAEKNPEQEDTEKIKTQISSLMSLTEEGGRLGESLEYAEEYMQYLSEDDSDRAGILFRMARINKKQGNEMLWRERMTEIVRLYPETVYGQTASAALKSTDIEKAASAYSPQR